jgi:hypothetical protein
MKRSWRKCDCVLSRTVEGGGPITGWIIDDTGFPKKGKYIAADLDIPSPASLVTAAISIDRGDLCSYIGEEDASK